MIEVIGGLVTGSLALLANAGHIATDVAALGLSLGAIWLAARPATPERSFGFQRAEILAAFINAATLVAVSLFIFWEAFNRLEEPPEVDSGPMLIVAVAGLLANTACAWVLMRGGAHAHNLNARGAFLHAVGDLLGSVGAIVSALIMLSTGWYLADPILSAVIGGLILWSSWKLLRESVDVLLEAAPSQMAMKDLRDDLTGVAGVVGVHDMHVWTVTSGFVAISAHVEVDESRPWVEVLVDLDARVREAWGIVHVTFQPEPAGVTAVFRGCSLDSPEGREACMFVPTGAHRDHAAAT